MLYTYQYPHAAISTDCCVFGYDGSELKVLLIQRREDPFKGQWAFPGGFLRMDETVDECAMRELASETHLQPMYLEQFHVFSAVNRDPRERVVTIAFLAFVPISDVKGGDDAAKAKWFSVDQMPHLAFDHQLIFQTAREALKEKVKHEALGYFMLDKQFTSQQLIQLYETILGDTVDSRTILRKMLSSNLVEEAPEAPMVKKGGTHPKLYSFAANSYAKLREKSLKHLDQ